MKTKSVKDLMIPVEEYAVVSEDATLYDSFVALENAQKKVPTGKQKHRAVLIVDKNFKIVGRLGHMGFLKALEPKYNEIGDLKKISGTGLSKKFLTSMMENFGLWDFDIEDIRKRVRKIKAVDVMHPFTEHIDQDTTISEAIHKIIMWDTLSILVTDEEEQVIGILRLADLFDEVKDEVLELQALR